MTIFKNISYMLSHVFFMLYLYLFMIHRYSKSKTIAICFISCNMLNLMDILKLNLYPDNDLVYLFTTLAEIAAAQFTGLLIAKKRDSRVLFVSLSASNYVIVGSITASILYICTGRMHLALLGNLLVHLIILLILYYKIGNFIQKFCERDLGINRWGLCLIPVFFYCSFSCLAFFPFTLYEHPENILVSMFLMITMLVSYVVVLHYLDSETKQVEAYWKNVMFESYVQGLESQNYLMKQSEQNLKILRHDMRHYSTLIDSLLDQKEYEEIRNVTGHINEVVNENKITRYCENLVINTILLQITEHARALDVALRLDVQVQEQLPVNEYEFFMVLANLLENAMYSVKDLNLEDKYINAKIHCTTDHLLIDIENKYTGKIHFDSVTGLPKSRRGEGHGLGMQSVQAFSDKLGGNIECYCEENMFRIILFVKFSSSFMQKTKSPALLSML